MPGGNGTSATLLGLSKLEIQNTLFVSKNGDDVTALPNRWDKPYATHVAASAAALAGDAVYTFAGTYNIGTADIIKSRVHYHFELGAIIVADVQVISDFGLAKTISVDGWGSFQTTVIDFNKGAIQTGNVLTTIKLRCLDITGISNGIAIQGGPDFDLTILGLIGGATQYGIFLTGNIAGTINFHKITTVTGPAVVGSSLNTDLVAREIIINGGEIDSPVTFANTGIFTFFTCNNTRFFFNNIRFNNTSVATNGGLILATTGGVSAYFHNCHGVADNGYGAQIGIGTTFLFRSSSLEAPKYAMQLLSTANVEAKNSKFRSNNVDGGYAGGAVNVTGTSELDMDDCDVIQNSAGGTACVMDIQNANVRVRNSKFVADASLAQSLRNTLAVPVNMSVELQCATNKAIDPNITNVIAGTNIVVDAGVIENTKTFF